MRDLQKDLEICQSATPGPWEIRGDAPYSVDGKVIFHGRGNKNRTIARFPYGNIIGKPKGWGKKDKAYQQLLVNIEFIAEAREGWPKAIKRATDAEEENTKLKTELKSTRSRLVDVVKALKMACKLIDDLGADCSVCRDICKEFECDDDTAECWKKYFITKARESRD